MSAIKKQKGLGRGLDALLGDAPKERAGPAGFADGKARTTLPVEWLAPNPDQPRRTFAADAIEELADSIRAKGMLQPILVRPLGAERFEIVAGERRWRAAQTAQLHDVPVIIRELTDIEAAEIALVENVQRVDLDPVEEATAYRRLIDEHGRTQDEIARAVGKSRSHVANAVRLLSLPPFSLDLLAKGKISAGHARAILGAPDPDALARLIEAKGLSVRDAERLARGPGGDEEAGGRRAREGVISESKQKQGGRKDADTRALEADLASVLGLEVEIDHSPKGAGKLVLAYRTLEQLDDLVRRLMNQRV